MFEVASAGGTLACGPRAPTTMADNDPNREVTVLLRAAAGGGSRPARDLLPLVYAELRALAEARMRQVPSGHTLQPTALVHEAYLRLIDSGAREDQAWNGRGHFFGAAAQAMRDILVEQARRKGRIKHGGDRRRIDLEHAEVGAEEQQEDMLALDEALTRLEREDARKAQIVMLRYFAGLSQKETADILGVSERTVEREWKYIKVWLRREMAGLSGGGDGVSDD